MKTKEAWYAVVGGVVGAVLTMAVCSFSPLGAQSDAVSFETVTCRELNVVDKNGDGRVWLWYGGVHVFGEEGITGMRGGQVTVVNASNGTGAKMGINEHGGGMVVFGKGDGKPKDRIRAAMSVSEYGSGVIATWDKNGHRLANLK